MCVRVVWYGASAFTMASYMHVAQQLKESRYIEVFCYAIRQKQLAENVGAQVSRNMAILKSVSVFTRRSY